MTRPGPNVCATSLLGEGPSGRAMPPSKGMGAAWAAGRRIFAVVAFALVLSAVLIELESVAHVRSGALHVLAALVAFLVSLTLVHGLAVFERWGF